MHDYGVKKINLTNTDTEQHVHQFINYIQRYT